MRVRDLEGFYDTSEGGDEDFRVHTFTKYDKLIHMLYGISRIILAPQEAMKHRDFPNKFLVMSVKMVCGCVAAGH